MNGNVLDREKLKYALVGGTILGGGGGGSRESGEKHGEIALEFGEVLLKSIDDFGDEDIILTVSGVGAPAAVDKYVSPRDYVETVKIYEKNTGEKIAGIITNENGGSATINGWIQSSVLGIPLIDAPANGRAHPTGAMGSMLLDRVKGFVSHQAVSGGNPKLGNAISGFYSGGMDKVAKMVRQASVEAGGTVAVARNGVSAKYVRENAAIGGISHAIQVGSAFYSGLETSPEAAIENVVKILSGEVIASGAIDEYELTTEGGFDVGKVIVDGCELTFWNEYMTIEKDGERIGTFPDLIMTFDKETGYPVTSAEIEMDREIVVINVPKSNIILGSPMYDVEMMKSIEPIIGKEIERFL